MLTPTWEAITKAGPILPSNIPSALTPGEAAELYRLAKDRTVLEFGSLLGYSTIVLAQAATRVFAVDPHQGYPLENPRGTLTQFIANLEKHMVMDRVVPIVGKGQDLMSVLRPGAFDLVFIDITRAANLLLEVSLYLQIPTIAIHDYGIPKWTGATEAIEEYSKQSGRRFRLVDTLAVFDAR